MPATHLSLHYHLIFSTKHRLKMITKDWRPDLHAYLGGIVRGINGVPLAIGGIDDHVHLLLSSGSSAFFINAIRKFPASDNVNSSSRKDFTCGG